MAAPISILLFAHGATSAVRTLGKTSTASQVVAQYAGVDSFKGKTAVVTGGASGIGLETVKALASAGFRVVVASRDPAGCEATCNRYVRKAGSYTVPDADLAQEFVDLANLTSVVELSRRLALDQDAIDLLVFNAGIMALPNLQYSSDGFELQMATNHMGHFLLYRLLEDKLKAQTDPTRVVVLSSTAHQFGNLDTTDLHFRTNAYTPWGAYGNSKLANLLFAKSVADRTAHGSVTSLAVHPGVIKSPLWRHTPAAQGVAGWLVDNFVANKNVEQGAATTLYACLSREAGDESYRGAYLSDCDVAVPSAMGRDPELRRMLWDVTEEQLRSGGYLE